MKNRTNNILNYPILMSKKKNKKKLNRQNQIKKNKPTQKPSKSQNNVKIIKIKK